MPFCGRKFNGSGYIGSRWSSFLDLGHGRNIRLPHTHAHTHSNTQTHTHPFQFFHQIYSAIETVGSNREVFICLGCQASRVHIFLQLFLSSLCLFRCFIYPCVCVSHALLFCFPNFHKPPQWFFWMLELQADKFGDLLKKVCGDDRLLLSFLQALVCVYVQMSEHRGHVWSVFVWMRAVICLWCACVGGCVWGCEWRLAMCGWFSLGLSG